MYATNDPSETRQPFFNAWEKFNSRQPLSPLEQQLVQVIVDHPEYRFIFDEPTKYLHKAYSAEETNPFMHFGMHLALRDQVSLDRPAGIRHIFETLCDRLGDPLLVEHKMIECLIEALWGVMNSGGEFDEEQYMRNLEVL